jgi:YD repeat-containing protein
MKRITYSLIFLFIANMVMAAQQHVPAVTQREDIARQGVMDGFDFGPFKMPEMTAIVDSFIRKPKMTKPFHFSEAEMNALVPKNIADAIEIIRPPRSNSHGSANLRYRIQTPPERTHMSPAFDIRYVSEMKEQGMLGIGWTIGKFILQKDAADNSYIWNYKRYPIPNNSEDDKITITEDDIVYTFVKSSDPKLFVLDNSVYNEKDTIKYYYAHEKGTPVDAKRNYVKIDSIGCKYKEDMIPHVKIKFDYNKENGLLEEILVQTSKEKYDFTKKDAHEEKEERYENFCKYTFNTVEAADEERNKSKYLLESVMQTFVYTVGKKHSYKDFIHSFEYYDDKETIELLDELVDIYVDPALTDNEDSVMARIDRFRINRTDMLKVAHTPLGACYTVNYGREIIKKQVKDESTGENVEKEDTMLVMKYLKINDGYTEDGPLVLNRYSYAGGEVFEIEPVDRSAGETENDKKPVVVCFDTVYTYNMSPIKDNGVDEILWVKERHYDSKCGSFRSGSLYESESPVVKLEVGYKADRSDRQEKTFKYGNNGSFEMTVNDGSGYNMKYEKKRNGFSYSSGSVVQSVETKGNTTTFEVTDNGNLVFKEQFVKNESHATLKRYKDQNNFISYDLTYDEYGNMIKCVMPLNNEGAKESLTYYYEYDRRFNQYQTGVADSRGFTSHMEDYDYTIGQPKTIRDINGYVKKFGYRFNAIIDTVVSPVRIDNAAGNSKKIYSAASEFSDVDVVWDRKTMGIDRKDTLKLGVDIEIKDSVKNALLSDATREKLTELLSGKNESVVMMDTCKLTFDLDNLHFGDTVAFVECYCNNVITTPSSIQLKRYDEYNPENDKLATSLYVDGVGRELYRKNEVPTVYDATRYDVLAQQTYLIKPYEKTMPESGDSVKYTPTKFDEVGRVKRLESLDKFGNKNVQIFDYDAVGRVTRYADNNSDYVYTYDMLGNITEVKDRKNFTTTSYAYDNAGNVISKTTPSGDVISYVYELDNLTEIKYPRIPSANVTNIYGNKNSSYGRRNRVALSYNSSVVDEYFYNQQGNVAKVRRTMIVPNGKILTYVTEFKYDTWGRLLEMIYPDGEILTYSFNNAGLANKVNGSKTFKVDEHKNFDYKYIDEVTYDYLGRLKEVNFHNGMKKTVQYDNDNKPVYSIIGGDLSNVGRTKLDSCMGDVKEGFDENSGMAAISNDGYLSSYFYDMSGNLAMNIGALNEKIYVNGQLSGVSSLIEDKHLIVNPYFEDQDSLCVKHVFLNGERVITKVVDTFSYGARPVRIERAGSNADEIGYEVDYEALHTLTSGDAIQERVATVGDEFSVEHKPFDYPQLRNANVDDGEDNEETDIYVYGVDKDNNLVGLFDKDKKMVLEIYKNADNTERIYKSDDLKFIPLIRSNEYMRDIANDMVVPMFELNNELHQVRDAFGR